MKKTGVLRPVTLPVLLSMLGFMPALSLAEQIAIPGTSVSLDAPEGFTVSRNYSGLENAETGSSIMVAELPANVQAEVARLFSDPGAAKSFFAQQGISIDGKSTLTVEGKPVPFLTGSQSKGSIRASKYMALLQGDMAMMIQFTILDPRSFTRAIAEKTLMSVKLSSALTLKQKADQLSFSFDAVAPFRVNGTVAGLSATLTTYDGTDPTGMKPVAFITRMGGAPDSRTPTQLALSLARRTKGFEGAVINSVKEVAFAGGPATYLEAVSVDRKLVQYARVQSDGVLIYLAVTGEKAEMDKVADVIADLASSVSARK